PRPELRRGHPRFDLVVLPDCQTRPRQPIAPASQRVRRSVLRRSYRRCSAAIGHAQPFARPFVDWGGGDAAFLPLVSVYLVESASYRGKSGRPPGGTTC